MINTVYSKFKDIIMSSVNIHEDSFYVTLLSNNSINFYPDNALSHFTNRLHKSLKFDERWVVGLVEIAYNSFSKPEAKQLLGIVNKMVDSVTIPPKKRAKRADVGDNKLVITVSDNSRIEYTEEELSKIAFKKGVINFGKMLETMESHIKSEELELDAVIVESVKSVFIDKVLAGFDKYNTYEYKKYTKTSNDFELRVNLGTPKANSVVIFTKKYNSVSEFLKTIIEQIPVENRDNSAFLKLFEILVPKKVTIPSEKDDKNLTISLNEYGAAFEIDMEEEFGRKNEITLSELIYAFHKYLKFDKELNTIEEANARKNVQIGVLDVLRNNDLSYPYTPKVQEENDFLVQLPVKKTADKYETMNVVLKIDYYRRINSFLASLYEQLPLDRRDVNVLTESLENIFDEIKNSNMVVGNPVLSVADVVLDTLPPRVKSNDEMTEGDIEQFYIYIYSDIIIPRTIGDSQHRLLRIIPHRFYGNHNTSFENVEYIPLEKDFIESISIDIRNQYGERINFKSSTSPTFVTLHFKKSL